MGSRVGAPAPEGSRDRSTGPVPVPRGRRGWILACAAVALVVALTIQVNSTGATLSAAESDPAPDADVPPGGEAGDDGNATEEGAGQVPAAFADAPWFPEYQAMVGHAYTWLDVFRQIGFEKMLNAESDFISVRDGARTTWAPPECECPRFTIRFYGSATTLGLGQRDDHTIPSELARVAWEDGVALEVVNRGMPGDQHWQQADRLGWDLTRYPPPDAVVFYSGVSEVNGGIWLARTGQGDVERPSDPMAEGFLNDESIRATIRQVLSGGGEQPPPPEGLSVPPSTTVPEMSPTEIGELVASRYAGSLPMSRDLVDLYDLTALWVWEPMRLSRPLAAGEPSFPDDEQTRTVVETARENLPEGVLDLSDALTSDPRPFFWDDVHHNEEAAAIVAARLWAELKPTLLSRETGGR
jgi:lysophospholipase L1-like esterase